VNPSCLCTGARALPVVITLLLAAAPAAAQEPAASKPAAAKAAEAEKAPRAERDPLPERILPPDMAITKTAQVTIRGARVPYRATAGTQPVWNEDGKSSRASSTCTTSAPTSRTGPAAARHLVQRRSGIGVSSGCTSATRGPRFLEVDPEGFPVQPYGVRDNPHSILDVADIVYVDPVNTGFSRIVGDADRKQFFGVNEDIAYLARWIDEFVSRHGAGARRSSSSARATAPRACPASRAAAERALDVPERRHPRVADRPRHLPRGPGRAPRSGCPTTRRPRGTTRRSPPELQKRDLDDLLPEVEAVHDREYMPALVRGGFLDEAPRKEVARAWRATAASPSRSCSTTTSPIPTSFFWKELLRDRGPHHRAARLALRGIDRDDAG
jgi:hypothetical protein